MTISIGIPLTTIPADQSSTFGPYTVQAGDSLATLTVLRNVANGLDANPGTSVDITVNVSHDGGSTWQLLASAGIPGGPIFFTDKQGVRHQYTQSTVSVGLDLVRGLPSQAVVTLHGGPLAVQGSFVVT